QGGSSCNTFATLLRLASGEGAVAKLCAPRASDERSRSAQRPPMPLNHGRKAAKCRPTQETLRRALARACVEFREDRMIQNICPGAVAALAIALATVPAVAWEPNKPVEIVVAAGAGGASDQMARMMQAAIQKNNLMKQPMVVSLKGGASGAEALIYMKSNEGDPNKVLIAYSLIYMLPPTATIPQSIWKFAAPSSCERCAYLTRSGSNTRQRTPATCRGTTFPPASKKVSTSNT